MMRDGEHATRVPPHHRPVGLEPVETFIDRSLSLKTDRPSTRSTSSGVRRTGREEKPIEVRGSRPTRVHAGFINPRVLDEQRKKLEDERAQRRIPERPQRDVLQFC